MLGIRDKGQERDKEANRRETEQRSSAQTLFISFVRSKFNNALFLLAPNGLIQIFNQIFHVLNPNTQTNK
jgi:hypothetical protein